MKVIQKFPGFGPYLVNKMVWDREDYEPGMGQILFEREILDIRRYEERGGKLIPRNGISFDKSMIVTCAIIMSLPERKIDEPIHAGSYDQKPFFVYDVLGTISEGLSDKIRLTKTAFISPENIKYDIRPWNDDYTKCNYGLMLPQNQYGAFQDTILEYIRSEGLVIPRYDARLIGSTKEELLNTLLIMMDKTYVLADQDALKNYKEFLGM